MKTYDHSYKITLTRSDGSEIVDSYACCVLDECREWVKEKAKDSGIWGASFVIECDKSKIIIGSVDYGGQITEYDRITNSNRIY